MNQARLLIVEDEAIVAADLEDRLTRLGYVVAGIAASGKQALVLAAQFQPDLVLMDIRLQGEPDGIDVARELRARWGLPIVFLTACAEEATVERAKLAEPYGYLLKPFEYRELGVTIELALYKHQAERKLRASEEHHRSVLQTAMDGIWLADMQGRLLEVNAAYCRMSGYSEQELLALRISDLEAVESADDIATHVQKTMTQGEDRFETRHRRKDGSIYDVEVSVQYRPGAGGQTVSFFRDLTKRKQTEQALLASEEKFRSMAEQTTDLIALTDVNGLITYASLAAESLFQYAPEEMCGRHFAEFLDESARLSAMPAFRRALEDGGRTKDLELTMKRKDGSTFNGELNGSSFRSATANGTLVVIRDITNRKRADAALREKLNELERMNRLMVGRELRMIELKREVNELCGQLNLPKRYSPPDNIASESNPANP